MGIRQPEVDKSEVQDWLRHPVTEWFFAELKDRIGDPDIRWRGLPSWEEVCREQGKARVLDMIRGIVA